MTPNSQKPLHPMNQNNRYKASRADLCLILLLSVINLFAIAFADRYFLFSTYITQIFAYAGVISAQELGANTILYIYMVLGVLCMVPYLLCVIFSKKHPGWMVAALVLFSLDSLLFFMDTIPALASGEISLILDIVIRIACEVSLILGVKQGVKIHKHRAEYEAAPEAPVEQSEQPAEQTDDFNSGF